jgi:hypothetical protein
MELPNADDGLSTAEETMINELDRVVLASELPEHGLKVGDIGTVVLVHGQGKGYEVEFVSLDGETVAVVSLLAHEVRNIRRREVPHARLLAAP